MYKVVLFFREAFRFDEQVDNAAARALSTKTEPELLALRDGLDRLRQMIEAELQMRCDEALEPEDVTPPWERSDGGGPPYDAATATGMYDHD